MFSLFYVKQRQRCIVCHSLLCKVALKYFFPFLPELNFQSFTKISAVCNHVCSIRQCRCDKNQSSKAIVSDTVKVCF